MSKILWLCLLACAKISVRQSRTSWGSQFQLWFFLRLKIIFFKRDKQDDMIGELGNLTPALRSLQFIHTGNFLSNVVRWGYVGVCVESIDPLSCSTALLYLLYACQHAWSLFVKQNFTLLNDLEILFSCIRFKKTNGRLWMINRNF